MFFSKITFLGDWDINNPTSSNVIYDEQSPCHPSSHSASIFEESHVPVTEESLMRVQIRIYLNNHIFPQISLIGMSLIWVSQRLK